MHMETPQKQIKYRTTAQDLKLRTSIHEEKNPLNTS